MNTRMIEITAKSEDEAMEMAKGELNEHESIQSSEILSAPARGIFGFVGKQEFKMRFNIVFAPPAEEQIEVEASSDDDFDNEIVDSDYDSDYDSDFDTTDSDFEPEEKTYQPKPKPRRTRDSTRGRRNRDADEFMDIPERPKHDVTEEVTNHPCYQQVFELIREVAYSVGIDELELEDYMRDGAWVIEASGENVSQLIGKRGRTLDSLQYLMNIIFNKGQEERIRLVMDAQGYREKRYRNLIKLASRMCKKVVSSRKSVELEPMSTLDRRTVHMALKDKNGIETFSKGSEPMRRVVIAPQKKRRRNPDSAWQATNDNQDSGQADRSENPSSVPMFMEEDV